MAFSNKFANYIKMLYHHRKQDSLILASTKIPKNLLKALQISPSDYYFNTDCPVFLPIKYSNTVDMYLDMNIVFYEDDEDGGYNLVDKFAVNGGPEIILEMGRWDNNYGIHLKEKVNRWDRRTDLMGATFINTLYENKVASSALFIYDSNGTIIGSRGHYQDQLFYILDRLNVTIETREESMEMDCKQLLQLHYTDICSGGYVAGYNDNVTIHVVTKRPIARTLLAGVSKHNAPDAWVYINVFGFPEWLTFFSALIIISLAMPLSQIMLAGSYQRPLLSDSFAITYLFLLQQGNHPERRLLSTRIISLTTSMVTLLVFIYFSNDITSKMTAGSPPHPVQNFRDVLDHGYKVIVVGNLELYLLRESKNDSAKQSVYKLFLEKEDKIIEKYLIAYRNDTEEANKLVELLPSWYNYTEKNFDLAAEQIINDKDTLWYCQRDCAEEEIEKGNVIELQMDDAHYTYGGWLLKPNSEYVSVISHYVIKGYETGIFNRIHQTYSSRAPIKIGMTEPGPLGINNVLFPFYILGLFMILSLLIAIVEKLVQIKNKVTAKLVDPVGEEYPSKPHTSTRSSGKVLARSMRGNKKKGEVGKEHTIASLPQTVKNAKSEVDLTVIEEVI